MSISGFPSWSEDSSLVEDSSRGEEGSWLTSSVMNDFSPKCSDTQDNKESSKSPTSDLPDINYRLKIEGRLEILNLMKARLRADEAEVYGEVNIGLVAALCYH